jgi:NADH-quinone oxidoreductase subunit E
MKTEEIRSIVKKHRWNRGGLISVLEDIQATHRYLPADALQTLADVTGSALSDIYAVATFYKSFSLEPCGEHLCSVCTGTACHVRGAEHVVREFTHQLGIDVGRTDAEQAFTLETVHCLGACALGPVVVMDGHYFSKVRSTAVANIIGKTRAGLDNGEVPEHLRHYLYDVACARCHHSLMDTEIPIDDAPSVRVAVTNGQEHGPLRLSALYGSFKIVTDIDIQADTIVDFFCPHCAADLQGASSCPYCHAPMVNLAIRPGGILQICSRRGCQGHLLDLEGQGF